MIISSIDIYKNKVVRLHKGNINNIFFFGYYKEYINFYLSINLKKIHIVCLDNIFSNKKYNIKIKSKIKAQIGGGVDKKEKVDFFIKNNFYKFVLGSIIFKNKKEFKKIISFFYKKIIVSLDCFNKFITINGWISKTIFNFNEIFFYLFDLNIKNIIYTNIEKDGTLIGIKKKELEFLNNKKFLSNIIISGGVSDYENILILNKKYNFDFIIGIAIYKFKIKINQLC